MIKIAYGTYVVPMLILGLVNVCAVAYFAFLLLHLPVKSRSRVEAATLSEEDEDIAALVGGVESTGAR